jgi:hypothetical protein
VVPFLCVSIAHIEVHASARSVLPLSRCECCSPRLLFSDHDLIKVASNMDAPPEDAAEDPPSLGSHGRCKAKD